jgi:hypothetical protein
VDDVTVFRSPYHRVERWLGCLLFAVPAVVAIALAVQGNVTASVVGWGIAAVAALAAWRGAWVPRLGLASSELIIQNPARRYRVPYAEITEINWRRNGFCVLHRKNARRILLPMLGKPKVQAAYRLRTPADPIVEEILRRRDLVR